MNLSLRLVNIQPALSGSQESLRDFSRTCRLIASF
jgi:hypothetical protein